MRRALIIGIDDYTGAPLSGCVNDANIIYESLSRHEDGSPNFDCMLLTAPRDSIKRSILKKNIEELFAHDADVVLFYFSGHGTITNLGEYLVTQDAEKYDEGVAMSDVISLANKALIREIVIILDCCHSGAFGEIPSLDNERAILREGVSILASSRTSQTSLEIERSGVFTSLVCDALKGGASDLCGNVTVANVYAYVEQALGAWDQRPLLKSHVSKLITLRYCKPEIE
ncbi:MAG: caspase family protein, partial [Bacteroidetes bacterium]|nr:caspase family protein [Bacteroidota bacterium]